MPDLTDPTRATNPALKRRLFVGLSAGMATLAGPASALAADAFDLGKPHPPLVPEDDPAIVVAKPALQSSPGRTIESYYAAPKNASAATPGVVIVMAVWGIDAQIRDSARRFAKAGYRTIAPNLYSGLGAPSGDDTDNFEPFRPMLGKLADDVVDADLAAGAEYLRSAGGGAARKFGVTGFCMGGSITLRQAVDHPELYGAAAVWYGKVRYGTTGNNGTITPIALAYADEINTPLAGSWGERDTGILGDDVRALERRLEELKKPRDLKVYASAGHGFFDDTRSSYDAFAAEDGWKRTLSWFSRYLR